MDTNRLLVMIPVRKAPGVEVPYMRDPRFGNINYPTYFDQVPFLGFFEWTAEYRVSTNPEVWEPRSGSSSLGLDLTTAISRYGRYLTLKVSVQVSSTAPLLWATKLPTVAESKLPPRLVTAIPDQPAITLGSSRTLDTSVFAVA